MLAYWNDEVAGCIALTKMKDAGACEMKRLYVRPEFRKNKIGRVLIEELLSSAKQKDIRKILGENFLRVFKANQLGTN